MKFSYIEFALFFTPAFAALGSQITTDQNNQPIYVAAPGATSTVAAPLSTPTLVYNCNQMPLICENVAAWAKANGMTSGDIGNNQQFYFDPSESAKDSRRNTACGNFQHDNCPQMKSGGKQDGTFVSSIAIPSPPPQISASNEAIIKQGVNVKFGGTQVQLAATPGRFYGQGLAYSCDEFPPATFIEGGDSAEKICALSNWKIYLGSPATQSQPNKNVGKWNLPAGSGVNAEQDWQAASHVKLRNAFGLTGSKGKNPGTGTVFPFIFQTITLPAAQASSKAWVIKNAVTAVVTKRDIVITATTAQPPSITDAVLDDAPNYGLHGPYPKENKRFETLSREISINSTLPTSGSQRFSTGTRPVFSSSTVSVPVPSLNSSFTSAPAAISSFVSIPKSASTSSSLPAVTSTASSSISTSLNSSSIIISTSISQAFSSVTNTGTTTPVTVSTISTASQFSSSISRPGSTLNPPPISTSDFRPTSTSNSVVEFPNPVTVLGSGTVGPITIGPQTATYTGPTTMQTLSSLTGPPGSFSVTTTTDQTNHHHTILPIWFSSGGLGIVVIPLEPDGGIIPPPLGFPEIVIGSDGQPTQENNDKQQKTTENPTSQTESDAGSSLDITSASSKMSTSFSSGTSSSASSSTSSASISYYINGDEDVEVGDPGFDDSDPDPVGVIPILGPGGSTITPSGTLSPILSNATSAPPTPSSLLPSTQVSSTPSRIITSVIPATTASSSVFPTASLVVIGEGEAFCTSDADCVFYGPCVGTNVNPTCLISLSECACPPS